MKIKQLFFKFLCMSMVVLLMAVKCVKSENDHCHQHITIKNNTITPICIYEMRFEARSPEDYVFFMRLDSIGQEGISLLNIGENVCLEELYRRRNFAPEKNGYRYYICDTNRPPFRWYPDTLDLFKDYNILKIVELKDSTPASLQRAGFTIYYP